MKYQIVINGIVQGVGCRALVRSVGRKMNLSGVVRNLENGEVEAYVEARDDDRIQEFVDLIKKSSEETAVDIMKIQVYNEGQNEFYSGKPRRNLLNSK